MTVFLDEFVAGAPAPFATRGERPWKDALVRDLAAFPADRRGTFVELAFVVAPAIGYPGGADIDNLCEPMFSAVINQLGWCSGSRPNMRALRASKSIGGATGCRIRITDEPWPGPLAIGKTLLDATAARPLPTSARDAAFIDWVASSMIRPASAGTSIAVEVSFTGPINIGDVATGRLKNVVDCLQPILGGSVGRPGDDRVIALQATRQAPAIDGVVRIRVVEIS